MRPGDHVLHVHVHCILCTLVQINLTIVVTHGRPQGKPPSAFIPWFAQHCGLNSTLPKNSPHPYTVLQPEEVRQHHVQLANCLVVRNIPIEITYINFYGDTVVG